MSVIIFILILAVLIVVHEYGHFIVAKKGGIRVDEFGLGYPPRAKKLFRRNGTDFTLNWLPFGGFVKIFGENPDDESLHGEEKHVAFVNKPKWLQALVLFAGPFMNFFFAWLVILASLWIGLPTNLDSQMDKTFIQNETTIVTEVLEGSPAKIVGIEPGDVISNIVVDGKNYGLLTSEELRNLVLENPNKEFVVSYSRQGETNMAFMKPKKFDGEDALLGIGINNYGVYKPDFLTGFIDSFKFTWSMIVSIAGAFWGIVTGLFGQGGVDIESLTGPVGIVGLVGDATKMGLVYVLSFVAIISINLGVINLIPFPALDGGRLLFILIEKIKGGKLNYNIINWINFIGFSLLIALMVFVTYRDILKLA